ncbi:MAG TPA: hypothetical protein VF084_12525 [Nitrososphaeraceae archaeon]
MLGDIIYEQKGKISGYRILDVEGPTIETSITGTGIINGIEVSDIVTYWSKPSSYQSSIQNNEKTFDAEGQGVILTKDGEMVTWKGYGIGRYNGRNRTDRGSVFFKASNGKLAFLNNKIGVFEYEADENGNTNGKIWEWK